MANSTLTNLFVDIADAIRDKDGTTQTIPATTFPDRIRTMSTSEDLDAEMETQDDLISQIFEAIEIKSEAIGNGSGGSGGGESGGGEAEAALAAMIDGSITDITSNAEKIAASAFRSRSALTSVKFPNATEVGNEAFWECIALKRADFSNVTSFGNYVFYNALSLTALVLRGNDIPHISSASILNNTPIKSGRGYI